VCGENYRFVIETFLFHFRIPPKLYWRPLPWAMSIIINSSSSYAIINDMAAAVAVVPNGACNVIKIYDYLRFLPLDVMLSFKCSVSCTYTPLSPSALNEILWRGSGGWEKKLHNTINYTLYLRSDNYDNSIKVVVWKGLFQWMNG
jgi:hypothetical protein